MLAEPEPKLGRLLRPRHIAFIGGSQVAGPIRACRRGGYEGDIWVVNPNATEIEGIACVASIADLPQPPDAALIGLSPERSINAVRELAAAGCGGAVVMVSGFREIGRDGETAQAALIEAAGDMPVIGPNCMGVLNQFDAAAVWGDDNHIERLTGSGAAIVSQSGALLIGITNVEQAFPLGYAISTGNQAVVDMGDVVRGLLADDRVKAIGLYVEGFDNAQALGSACFDALKKGVPVIALKGGDQPAGAEVALSHTASMVVERDLWEAFCRRFGIVEVSSPKALVETLKLLTVGGLAMGNRVTITSYSGGANGLAATRAGPLGLTLPAPLQENHQRLRDVMPETVNIANPLDLNIPYRSRTGISMQDTAGVADAIIALGEGVADQLVFFIDVPRLDAAGLDKVWCDSLEALIEVRAKLGIPIAVAGILPEGLSADFRQDMQDNGVAALCGMSETMEALAVNAKLAQIRLEVREAPPPLLPRVTIPNLRMIDEAASKKMLKAYGLQVPASRAVSPDEAVTAAEEVGYPVAVKVLSETIAHKAKLGGVQIWLDSPELVSQATCEIVRDVEAADGGHRVERVLVEKMIPNAVAEIIIGIKRHGAMGLALMVGLGGSQAEKLSKFETLLLPASDDELIAAVKTLGFTHQPRLFDAVCCVARFATDHATHLETLDVNPVILTTHGEAIAADALIVMGKS